MARTPDGVDLYHVNGVPDDNRLENLRIVCPNCAATLDTHCARNTRRPREPRDCALCGASFSPNRPSQRYCSQRCGQRAPGRVGPAPSRRRAERPPLDDLLAQVADDGFLAVGRRYGVSDNAIRKWIVAAEREARGPTPDRR